MRVMVIVKATEESEAGRVPDQTLLAAMMAFNDELVRAGVILAGDGLTPSARGARVRFSGGKTSVIDGPFAEAKELVAGYWVWQVRDLDEAIAWVRRMPTEDGRPGGAQSEVEIRPLMEADDFGDQLTPELRAEEAQLRSTVAAKTSTV